METREALQVLIKRVRLSFRRVPFNQVCPVAWEDTLLISKLINTENPLPAPPPPLFFGKEKKSGHLQFVINNEQLIYIGQEFSFEPWELFPSRLHSASKKQCLAQR